MIGKIKGILVDKESNNGLIETSGGVSYICYLTPHILLSKQINDVINIFTYLQVRDDALVLFGFDNKNEYQFYILLLSVSGVGPKTAYLVVSYGKVNETIQAIKTNDVDFFSNIKGLGKKTAMKIILELSQKLKQEFSMDKMYISDEDKTVVDALMSLGFKQNEARTALTKIPKDLPIEEKIKHALKFVK